MKLSQWDTPEWAAEALLEKFFPHLGTHSCVLEPTVGTGGFLKPLPDHVPGYGVEICPDRAQQARVNTGRHVVEGDVRTCDLPWAPTDVVGNPPFVSAFIDVLLGRVHGLMPEEGRCGLLLPAYMIQTSSRVVRWAREWSIHQTMIPRDLFPRLRYALCFVIFSKARLRNLWGFALYREAQEIQAMALAAKQLLRAGPPRVGVWRALVTKAVSDMGGAATVEDIYRHVAPNAPVTNNFPREKIRQTCQRHLARVGRGRYKLKD